MSGGSAPRSAASTPSTLQEPHRSRFIQMIRDGAAARDMHATEGQGSFDGSDRVPISDGFLARELSRVEMHAESLCAPLFARVGSASHILDVGCGTGGTSVALSLPQFGAHRVVGIDACESSVAAARVRASGYGLSAQRIEFRHVAAGSPLPFADGEFDLVTCISVLEFVGDGDARREFIAQMLRVVRPGGYLMLATPNPFRLREYHSRRLLGDWRRVAGFPWSSPPWELRAMFAPHRATSMARDQLRRHRLLRFFTWAAPLLALLFPWQRWLVRKRLAPGERSNLGPGL